MKCEVTSNKTHRILISKDINYKSYKEICSGEPKKFNLGYVYEKGEHEVENNSLVHLTKSLEDYLYGKYSVMAYDWEILSKFFSIYNIEPTWVDCNGTYGWYDDELGTGWNYTGCMHKV